jgi:hypothetical protein
MKGPQPTAIGIATFVRPSDHQFVGCRFHADTMLASGPNG